MKRQLLLVCALVLSASLFVEKANATGTEKTWDFSVWILTADDADANLTLDGTRFTYEPATAEEELKRADGTIIEDTKGLLFTAGAGKFRLDFGGKRFQMNGGNLKITIPAAAGDKVTVYAKPANKTDLTRGFGIVEGGTLNATESSSFIQYDDAKAGYVITEADADATFVFDATGAITLNTTGGINITKITVAPSTSTGIDEVVAEKAIVRTEYYSVTGAKLAAPTAGLNIAKIIYEDGSSKATKIFIKD